MATALRHISSKTVISLIALGIFLVSFGLLWFQVRGGISLFQFDRVMGSMNFEAEAQAYVNQPFPVRILFDTKDQPVNAAGVFIQFDPEKFQVIELSTIPSFCQYYPEKKFDNQLGLISMACGAPHPGYRGQGVLLEVVFMPTEIGQTIMYLDPKSQLLKSDGVGTNIIEDYQQMEVQIGTAI